MPSEERKISFSLKLCNFIYDCLVHLHKLISHGVHTHCACLIHSPLARAIDTKLTFICSLLFMHGHIMNELLNSLVFRG